jgi:serine phosphatase RsbU (regulator of sigma subunit)/anti-sigma regulatory factor (Ser/Thr protein kinase)
MLGSLLAPVETLRAGIENIGRGDLDTRLDVHDRTELGLLADAVNDMAARLKTARAENLERERLGHELELARAIQQRLLPREPRSAGAFALLGAHRPAAEVGGDYYDFLERPDGRVAIAIADVAGKGLAGCLVTSMLSALVRALHTVHASPSALLVELERHLAATLEPGEFVTMFYALLDPARGRLTFASAGHMPLLVWRAESGRVEWHATRGIPLAAIRGGALAVTLDDRVLDMAPGDLVAQFTDGITEAEGGEGKQPFGLARVERIAREHAKQGPETLVATLRAEVARWTGGEPGDDETLLVVGRRGGALDGACASAPAHETRTPRRHDALARLSEAEASGPPLVLGAHLDALSALGPWLAQVPDLRELESAQRHRLELALYEACANVAEHGLHLDPTLRFDVWWVPGAGREAPSPTNLDARIRSGFFLLRDHGFPFSPGRWRPRDLDDRGSRLQGRGLGLDLIHLTMDEVVYRPATAAGNITVLTFDPAKMRRVSEEDRHG